MKYENMTESSQCEFIVANHAWLIWQPSLIWPAPRMKEQWMSINLALPGLSLVFCSILAAEFVRQSTQLNYKVSEKLDQLFRGPVQLQLLLTFVYCCFKNPQGGKRTHFMQVKAKHSLSKFVLCCQMGKYMISPQSLAMQCERKKLPLSPFMASYLMRKGMPLHR